MSLTAAELHRAGKTIGFVPTMGALHAGHISLIHRISGECDVRVASIFVNPIQFGPREDLSTYPRDEQGDLAQLEDAGCDIVFCPSSEQLYPEGYQSYVEVTRLSQPLCGKYRPGHFRGVATIVMKLFNITRCDVAAFGLKDYQQSRVIARMVRDLNLPVKLIFGETVREPDGLAMSSRNLKLTPFGRQKARAIPDALELAVRAVHNGERDAEKLIAMVASRFAKVPELTPQYIEIVDCESLQSVTTIADEAQILVAVYVDGVRLIDNRHLSTN